MSASIDGNAIVYCQGGFATTSGKTAHGLVRFTRRYRVEPLQQGADAQHKADAPCGARSVCCLVFGYKGRFPGPGLQFSLEAARLARVFRAAQSVAPVRGNGHARDIAGVTFQAPQLLSSFGVPEAQHPVLAASRKETPAVWRKGHGGRLAASHNRQPASHLRGRRYQHL
jgi:hypothetical protein